VPTVRATAEQIARAAGSPLIRINPDGAACGAGDIPLAAGALETLLAIDAARELFGYTPAHSWRDHVHAD
jgi:predicted RNA polymerase sigma factor